MGSQASCSLLTTIPTDLAQRGCPAVLYPHQNCSAKVPTALQMAASTSSGEAHICSSADQPGLECLSNEQILPILLALDPESLLNCGRASPRLYRLVCDKEV